jgi:hypothetical protein
MPSAMRSMLVVLAWLAASAAARAPLRYPDTTDALHPEGLFILTSRDGANWTETNPRPGSYTTAESAVWTGSVWLSVGNNVGAEQIDTAHVLISKDGVRWSAAAHLGGARSVTWTGRQFVAVGGFRSSSIMTSPDGVHWTAQKTGTDKRLRSVVWTGERLVAVGEDNVVLTWRDGVTWSLDRMKVWGNHPGDLVWTGKRLFALQRNVGRSEAEVISSPDGAQWTEEVLWKWEWPPLSLVWTGRQFVAVGLRGHAWTSPDGKNWTRRKSGTKSDLYSVAWTGKMLVTVGYGGDILTSPDGITWTVRRKPLPQKSSVVESLNFVTWGNGQILILGDRTYLD